VAGPEGLTAGYTINLLAPVLGDRLLARAWVISAGQRLIVTRCELIEPHPAGDRLSAIGVAPVWTLLANSRVVWADGLLWA
jgi:acyl-coenzyme A thioesterase PaaI-like protein